MDGKNEIRFGSGKVRIAFFVIFLALIVALAYCARSAKRSRKAIGRSVALMVLALIPPVIGNSIIIISGSQTLSTVGYYIYFLGMNGVMFTLIGFTFDYCALSEHSRKYRIPAFCLLAADSVQLLLNTVWGHAFSTEAVMADGFAYYRLLPYTGQSFHRLVDYGILAAVIFVFFMRMINSPRINSEKYSVILVIMVVTTVWESYYIFSRTPIDRSMLGFGFFGIMVYHLSINFRPMRLLDSMLSHIASEMPEALYFFDSNDKCIWANQTGIQLVGIDGNDFEIASERLRKMYGKFSSKESKQHEILIDGETKSYVVEKHEITDDRGRLTGSFVSVRDNTAEQMTLRAEVFKATHDPLTGIYNRAGYNLLISRMDLWKTIMLLIDGDCFKSVNDTYGHEVGDKVLQRIASTLKDFFRSDDYVCRIGGDEFVVLMIHSDSAQKELIMKRINKINSVLSTGVDGMPGITVSVGIAHGRNARDAEELFEHADKALYETKDKGKKGFTFYEELVPEKE